MIGPPSHSFLVKQFAVEARTVGIGIILKQRYIEELWTERRATRMTRLVSDEMSTHTPRVEVTRPPP